MVVSHQRLQQCWFAAHGEHQWWTQTQSQSEAEENCVLQRLGGTYRGQGFIKLQFDWS